MVAPGRSGPGRRGFHPHFAVRGLVILGAIGLGLPVLLVVLAAMLTTATLLIGHRPTGPAGHRL